MQDVVAHVDNIKFDIEIALRQQIGAQPLPFPGMDKAGAAICDFFVRSLCGKGVNCPFRHVRGDKSVVCKHWLRGLCKKGDQCEFLHEYDMTKMPECFFYSKFNSCSNKECPFLHIDPESKIKDCPWYDRGFCRHGPNCRHRHTRRICCVNYLNGFCLEGLLCKYMHPRFELPTVDPITQAKKATIQCHHCGEPGHKIFACPKLPPEARQQAQYQQQHQQHQQYVREVSNRTTTERENMSESFSTSPNLHPLQEQNQQRAQRPLESVTCFKCGEKGHYANRCPKGHLAFLSSALQNHPNQNNEEEIEYDDNWN